MTDEEKALSILECMAIDMTGCLAETEEPMADVLAQRLAAINLAQDALRDRIAREKPVALTLEEVAKAIREITDNGGCPSDTDCYEGQDCHKCLMAWLAYRTKPKEGTT